MPITITPRQDYVFADNYTNLQDAVDAASVYGRPVFLGPGEYVEDQIVMPSQTKLIGSGIGMTKIFCNKAQVAYAGTPVEKTQSAFIRNVGYRQDAAAITQNYLIRDCEIIGNRTTDVYSTDWQFYHGIALTGSINNKIIDCKIRDFGGEGVSSGNRSDATDNRNLTVRGCHLESNLRGGVTVITGTNIHVTENYFTGFGHAGFHMENGNTATNALPINGLFVTNNTIEDVAQYPLWFANGNPQEVDGFYFTGNKVRNCPGGRSIQVQSNTSFISDNIFEDCDSSEYFISIAGNCIMRSNQFIRCQSGFLFCRVLGAFGEARCATTIDGNYFEVFGTQGNENTNAFVIWQGTAGSYQNPRGAKVINNHIKASGYETGIRMNVSDGLVANNRFESSGSPTTDLKYIFDSANTFSEFWNNTVDTNLEANLISVIG
jgi:hypothetical protein